MKSKFYSHTTATVAIALSISMCSCAGVQERTSNEPEAQSQTQESPLSEGSNEDTNSESQLPSISGGPTVASGSSAVQREVEMDGTISTDALDFTINSADFTDYVQSPSFSTGRYEYYTPNEGSVFLDVVATITNKKNHALNNPATVKCTFGDKYTYNSDMMYEDENGGFDYPNLTSIDPLMPKVAHYMISIPEEAQTSNLPIKVQISVKGSSEQFSLTIR